MKPSSLPLWCSTLVLISAHCLGQGVIGGRKNGRAPDVYLPTTSVLAAADPAVKAGENVTLTGKLHGGLMAIGGESPGWLLKYNSTRGPASIEVDMRAIKGTRESYDGEVTITGQIIARQYVERGTVLILKAATVVVARAPEKKL